MLFILAVLTCRNGKTNHHFLVTQKCNCTQLRDKTKNVWFKRFCFRWSVSLQKIEKSENSYLRFGLEGETENYRKVLSKFVCWYLRSMTSIWYQGQSRSSGCCLVSSIDSIPTKSDYDLSFLKINYYYIIIY